MNLTLKPSKCRSISIVQGSAKEIHFDINGQPIQTVKEKPEKYLGSLVTHYLKSSDSFNFIQEKLQNMLQNIDSSMVRGEYKLAVLSRYSLPSLRYALTVHDLTNTQLDSLDSAYSQYVKKWLKFPQHGATPAILYGPDGLKLMRPSDVYQEAHALAYAGSLHNADNRVQNALKSKLHRESQWKCKMSRGNAATCQEVLDKVSAQNDAVDPQWNIQKSKIKKTLQEDRKAYWRQWIQPLIHQGEFMKLIALEEEDLTWRSIMYDLPKNVLSFITRASINALPSADNLRTWGKRLNTKCPLCGNHETLHHILNNCKVSLDQGRFTLRHDSVLSYIVNTLKDQPQRPGVEMYADLDGFLINGGTIPQDIIATTDRPDIVLVDRASREVTIGELTVPFERNINEAHKRKVEKYSSLKNDIEDNGYTCTVLCFEIGSRGFIPKATKQCIHGLMAKYNSKCKFLKCHINKLCKLVILASYIIFNARKDPVWTSIPLLKP